MIYMALAPSSMAPWQSNCLPPPPLPQAGPVFNFALMFFCYLDKLFKKN
jgi:hypothetical protein